MGGPKCIFQVNVKCKINKVLPRFYGEPRTEE
jgi:hypothetical protein